MAFITKKHNVNGSCPTGSNDGTSPGNNEINLENVRSLNVKKELRPLARDLVSKAQGEGVIDSVDASQDRENIKRQSKDKVVDIVLDLAQMYEDKTGDKLYLDANSGNTEATTDSGSGQGQGQGGQGGGIPDLNGVAQTKSEPGAQGGSGGSSSDGTSNDGDGDGDDETSTDETSTEPSEPSTDPNNPPTMADIQDLIQSALNNAKPQPKSTTMPSASGKLEHWQMPLLKAIIDTNRQALLVGGAGTGKTTIAEQIAEYLGFDVNKQFYAISLSSGVSEAHLTGRMNMKGEFIDTEFLNIVENGGVILLDEFDNADPDVLVGLNSLLANDVMSTPLRRGNEIARRAQNCYIIATANTWGNGSSGSAGYVRKQLDTATLDRFVCSKMYLGQDRRIENLVYGLADEKPRYPNSYETLADNSPKGITQEVKKLRTSLRAIKTSVDDPRRNVRKIVGIRASAQGAKLIRQANFDFRSVLELYLSNWTDDELATIEVSRKHNTKDDYFQYDFSRFCESNRLAQ